MLRFSGSSSLAVRSRSGLRSIEDFLIRFFDHIADWQERAESRRRLRTLDDRMVRDIGLDAAQRDAEAAKPFWTS